MSLKNIPARKKTKQIHQRDATSSLLIDSLFHEILHRQYGKMIPWKNDGVGWDWKRIGSLSFWNGPCSGGPLMEMFTFQPVSSFQTRFRKLTIHQLPTISLTQKKLLPMFQWISWGSKNSLHRTTSWPFLWVDLFKLFRKLIGIAFLSVHNLEVGFISISSKKE